MRQLQWLTVFFAFMVGVFLPPASSKEIIYIDINSPQVRKFYLALPGVKAFDDTPQEVTKQAHIKVPCPALL